jgi:pimeloyl-ACP methyl ester carboxylesterase
MTEDKEFSPVLQTKMASHLPSAKIMDVRSGHMLMLSQPQALAEILNDFVDSLPVNSAYEHYSTNM